MNLAATGADLLRAILEATEVDLRRLVYADWLEEHGDDLQAEFIRLQCRINSLPFGDEQWHAKDLLGRELKIVDSMPDFLCLPGQLLDNYAWTGTGITTIEYDSDAEACWSRGFAYRVEMRLEAFMEHARALFEHHPITEVKLTDRDAERFSDGWFWTWTNDNAQKDVYFDPFPQCLPKSIWDKIEDRRSYTGHKSRKHALDSLSTACVVYGRDLAGLPPLKVKS
jgi:uncharacterized protein (TIGR02996 family)